MIGEPRATHDDRETLARLPQKFAEAWNRHDGVALGALFASDADFVNVLGMHWRGRAEIAEMHSRLLATIFAESKLVIDEVECRLLGSDAAAVRAGWTMTGHVPVAGTWENERTGLLLLIAARNGEAWELVDAQNTDKASAVPPDVAR